MIEIHADRIRGLTLWRPWPWTFTHADKRVENRQRRPPNAVVGNWLALHSGLHWDNDAWCSMSTGQFGEKARAVPPERFHLSGVITCVVRVERVTVIGATHELPGVRDGAHDPWTFGPVVIHTPDVIKLPTPVQCKGAQGYWKLTPEVFAAVRSGVRAATSEP